MSTVESIHHQALQLSPLEREELAHLLLESLPPVDEDAPITIDPDYEEELHRRIKSVNDGTAKLGDGEEFLSWLRDRGQRREPA